MPVYNHFLGIDIGKLEVVAALYEGKSTKAYPNSLEGFKQFFLDHQDVLQNALVVLETTGGYEQLFILELAKSQVAVHRANTRHVKSFIRSLSINGKTDAIDAKGLAQYGFERHERLGLHEARDLMQQALQALAQRRLDLNKSLTQEKNRAQAPTITASIKRSCEAIMEALQGELKAIFLEMESLLKACPMLLKKRDILLDIPGIGDIVSAQLVVLLPELGHLNRRQIASLVGLAPHPCDSGTKSGYRRTKGGRRDVRSVLFMAALPATRSKSSLGAYYKGLIARGKKKMVAIVALMRKIIVIANAKIKEMLEVQATLPVPTSL